MAISINANAVISWLRMYHVGYRHGVTCANLAEPVRMSSRENRQAISESSDAGEPVLCPPVPGQFRAEPAGDMDDNGHMQSTMRVARSMQQATKAFEMMVYPGSRHGIRGRHYQKLVVDFMRKTIGTEKQ